MHGARGVCSVDVGMDVCVGKYVGGIMYVWGLECGGGCGCGYGSGRWRLSVCGEGRRQFIDGIGYSASGARGLLNESGKARSECWK